MLAHQNAHPEKPARVVVLGAGGVLGKSLLECLKADGIMTLGVGSADIDLQAADASDKLQRLFKADDAVVFLSALTPDKGRDVATLMKNLRMAEAVASAVSSVKCRQVIYMSSDAVYPFGNGTVDETTPADPLDLYGVMHKAREVIMMSAVPADALTILRCTLVCAADDTHNSYGPNRFRRQAAKDGKITLGGEGKETRDHVFADDVAELIRLVLVHRSAGLLNAVSGRSYAFAEVARLVAATFAPPAEVSFSGGGGAVTHRHFDVTALHQAFPNFHFQSLDAVVAEVHRRGEGRSDG
ncbi:NAD(P)-dependent oxidoreductase [Tardiphaga sp. 42S5]|uniref:NAD-dependent epimerase/dehydratase family protein n=1 Tax=Tardiphaga sp. 42S5 TaxID=1404799 RepID=UPI002A59F037|nr:NAD(P)-dependent oxidoreductase [Tardiphaga sp. 42S5]WPO44274.1 NAD(P)-dependent oxidoreductase [Tardiphaga sp. 42S5]